MNADSKRRPYVEYTVEDQFPIFRCELRKGDLQVIGEFTRENIEAWFRAGEDAEGFARMTDFHAVSGDIDIP
jgi:hypothetical protein